MKGQKRSMQGIELAKRFFFEVGLPLFKEKSGDLFSYLCFGLVGAGSECFGFDDEISTDHDFEPRFCVFVPKIDAIGPKEFFLLEKIYDSLPKTYLGYKRSVVNPVGEKRHGVIYIDDFYYNHLGYNKGFDSMKAWLSVPDYFLAEAVNGEIFLDNYQEFTKIRNTLLNIPDDVKYKKMAGHLLLMAQSGQYNYKRCLLHNEQGAAQLAIFEFVNHFISFIYIFNGKYKPFYKWSFRGLKDLDLLSSYSDSLIFLLTSPNDEIACKYKQEMIDDLIKEVVMALNNQKLSTSNCLELEKQAYIINSLIKDIDIRNLNILYAI